MEELDNGGILGSPEVASPTRKKGRVSFGSNETKLYHPGDVVSTKKRKQVDGGETEPVLKKRDTDKAPASQQASGTTVAKKGLKRGGEWVYGDGSGNPPAM